MAKWNRRILFLFPILQALKGQIMDGLVNNGWNGRDVEEAVVV
jgi:hypothetical protein